MCNAEKIVSRGLLGVLIAGGLALTGFFPGYYYYKAQLDNNFVAVKGLAERDVRADLAVLDLKYVVTGNDVVGAQKELTEQQQIIVGYLKEKGFVSDEITMGRIDTNYLAANPYRSEKIDGARFILTQGVNVRSAKVDAVEKAVSLLGDVVAKGMVFDSQNGGYQVSYIFTRLNEIKPEMLSEATKNARLAADEFAKSSQSHVGKIRHAQQGVFSILPREEVPGVMEAQQINKKVRVVSTVEYYLE